MKMKSVLKVIIAVIVIGGGIGYFMVQAVRSSSSYYYSVGEFAAKADEAKNFSLRIAGNVKQGSVNRDLEQIKLTFMLADSLAEVPVVYKGAVPDNFAENRQVVVEGRLDAAGIFHADTLMTKCDSKYEAKVK